MSTPLSEQTQMAMYKRLRTLLKYATRTGADINAFIEVEDEIFNIFEVINFEFGIGDADAVATLLKQMYRDRRGSFHYGYPYYPSSNSLDKGYVPLFDVHRSSISNVPYNDGMIASPLILHAQIYGFSSMIAKFFPIPLSIHVMKTLASWMAANEEIMTVGGMPLLRQVVKTKTVHIAHQPFEVPSRVIFLPRLLDDSTTNTSLDVGGVEDVLEQAVRWTVANQYGSQITAVSEFMEGPEKDMISNKAQVYQFLEKVSFGDVAA